MKIRTLILAFAALALTCAVLRPTTAGADLRVHPKRVIFEGSSRSATVTVSAKRSRCPLGLRQGCVRRYASAAESSWMKSASGLSPGSPLQVF